MCETSWTERNSHRISFNRNSEVIEIVNNFIFCPHREAAYHLIQWTQLEYDIFNIGMSFFRNAFDLNTLHNAPRYRLRVTAPTITQNFCRRRFSWKPHMEERDLCEHHVCVSSLLSLDDDVSYASETQRKTILQIWIFSTPLSAPRYVSTIHKVIVMDLSSASESRDRDIRRRRRSCVPWFMTCLCLRNSSHTSRECF